MHKKKSTATTFLLPVCLAVLILFPFLNSYAADATPPGWVENSPVDKDIYYGVGVAPTRKSDGPDEEERARAYNYAVTELSQMAGQLIYSGFKDYQREVSGKPGENVAEQEVVSSIQTISENFLQGIEIRDRWQDRKAKQYHVFVAIDRDEANRQIKVKIKARETALQTAVDEGIKRLDLRFEKMEADVGQVKKDLAEVDERVDRTDRDISELFDQMQFVKDRIESLDSGEMNWSKGVARAKGIGVANPNFPRPLQKRSAEEAARMDAQAKLVELTSDLKIKVSTISKNQMLAEDTRVKEFEGVLHGSRQVGATVFNNDGTAEVVMEAGIKGLGKK